MTTEAERGQDQEATPAPTSEGTSTRRSPTRRSAKSTSKAPASAASKKRVGSGAAKKKTTSSGTSRRGAAKGQPRVKEAPVAVAEEVSRIEPRPLPRMLTRLREEVAPAMMSEFDYTTPMEVPRLSKIVLNIGLGEALENPRAIENATRDLSLISGQRPVTTRARKSIAAFKVREGMALGLAVSLRSRRMYEFFDRLVSSALPRIRDFRGLSREAFDGRGNYSLGIREQVIFPEIDYNSIDRIRGLQVVIVTTAPTDREGLRLLELLGVPFTRPDDGRAAA